RDGKGHRSTVSRRYFLQDAVFLVGLEGDDLAFLHELDAALRQPVFPIGLGRRSYVPSLPVAMPPIDDFLNGVRPCTPLDTALKQHPPLLDAMPMRRRRDIERGEKLRVRTVIEAEDRRGHDGLRSD